MENLKIDKTIKMVAQLAIDSSSRIFSKIIRRGARIRLERVFITDITEITEKMAKIDEEIVATSIDLVGDVNFKFLFSVNAKDSFPLTDLMLRREVGTTKTLDEYALSSIQEIANILASSISNVFSADFEVELKPCAPIVLHDYPGSVFEEFILDIAKEKDTLFVIESSFEVAGTNILCNLFLLPSHDSDKILTYIANTI
jgi:chemotaxis protein CheY-P-specific phosphatase CheC